jgi:putative salt-induced outer membrane protein YdiY
MRIEVELRRTVLTMALTFALFFTCHAQNNEQNAEFSVAVKGATVAAGVEARESDSLQTPQWVAELAGPEPPASGTPGQVSLSSVAIAASGEDRPQWRLMAQADAGTKSSEKGDEPIETEVKPLWSGNIEAGIDIEEGNTESFDIYLGAAALRKSERREFSLEARYDLDTEGGSERKENDVSVGVIDRRFRTEKAYWFARGLFSYDELEKLDYRVGAALGPGHMFANTEDEKMLIEGGLGAVAESFHGENSEVFGIALFHGLWTKKVFGKSVLSQDITIVPVLTKVGRVILTYRASVTTPVSERLSFRCSLLEEYDSRPRAADVDKNDLKIRMVLVYTF